ncbi:IAA acetyltransferase [plant metagenome]|uniref:IAA acetyltransferase n=1 Tax=plant metagenome TaxID=1297885 RepID=A0A484T9L0_9ZZZZ
MTLTVSIESPAQPEVEALLQRSNDYHLALYPPESCHFLDSRDLSAPHVTFWVARLQGQAVGCCALVALGGGEGEIKRLWVESAARGQRVGARLMDALEAGARGQGLDVVLLETGIGQPEALALYRSRGYEACGPFGNYLPDPVCVFLRKDLRRNLGKEEAGKVQGLSGAARQYAAE